MFRGGEIEEKQVDKEDMEGDEFEEEDYEEGEDYYDIQSESGEELLELIDKNSCIGGLLLGFDGPRSNKIRKCEASCDHFELELSLSIKPQDADYCNSHLPQLSDELENMIMARISLLEFRKLCLLSKRFLGLIRNGDLLKERRMIGVKEASVFMLASGEKNWWAYDKLFTFHKALPVLPCDEVFKALDKESLTAGTQLLVCGTDVSGPVIWTYEVLANKWFRGASMTDPRCLFASASTGDFAFVAGGVCLDDQEVLASAEKYDPVTKSWEPLRNMNVKRRMCSGVYMDDKFFVIGGQGENGSVLTCGEVYDEKTNKWKVIPGILNGLTLPTTQSPQSPPLVAVVNNNLYTIETSTNCLMVYLKNSNTWKALGRVPVRADISNGWGVAFKSLGNELLVIGGSTMSLSGLGMTIYTCCPNPNEENLNWKRLEGGGNSRSHFIMNCTVMMA